jgi:hypothetical protein
MGKVWVLDTETKGTGANVVPLEKVLEKSEPESEPTAPPRRPSAASHEPRERARPPRPKPQRPTEVRSTPLPPGHVRKRTTGEIGRVDSVDPQAGTATVLWLRQGRSSVVPLSAISRR